MYKFLILLLFICLSEISARNIPSYVKICKRTDPELSKCLVDSVNKLKPYLLKGIPEFRIPAYDPLEIPQVELKQGDGPVSFRAEFNKLKVIGAKDLIVKNVSVDIENLKLVMDLFFPHLRLESEYKLDGRILILPVTGNGYSDGNYTNIRANIVLSGNSQKRKGFTYISLKDRKVDLIIEGVTIKFENLFNGNKELSDSTNNFFNQNWQDILMEVKPVVEETIAEIVHGIVKQLFDLFPLEQLLPPK